jgi:hypothetical protein
MAIVERDRPRTPFSHPDRMTQPQMGGKVPRLSYPDQVMVRMLEVGICGTDKKVCCFEHGGAARHYLRRTEASAQSAARAFF